MLFHFCIFIFLRFIIYDLSGGGKKIKREKISSTLLRSQCGRERTGVFQFFWMIFSASRFC
jgi:hypothetical protein